MATVRPSLEKQVGFYTREAETHSEISYHSSRQFPAPRGLIPHQCETRPDKHASALPGATADFLERALEAFLDNIARVARGEAPHGEVSREREY